MILPPSILAMLAKKSVSRVSYYASVSFVLAGFFAFSGTLEAKTLATVNGVEITDTDLAIAIEDLGQSLPPQLQGKERDKQVLSYLIDMAMLAQRGVSDKVTDTPEYKQGLAYYTRKLEMEIVLGQASKGAVNDQAIQKVYDDALKAHKPEYEVHARHILVATEDEAKAVEERLKKGADFAALANELSKDPGSKGGDLGFFTRDKMVPEFADVAFKLDVGQVSDPVKTQFGWHVIKVEEKREKPFPEFSTVKDSITRYVGQRAQGELVNDLRKTAKVERFDEGDDAAPKAPDATNTPPKQ